MMHHRSSKREHQIVVQAARRNLIAPGMFVRLVTGGALGLATAIDGEDDVTVRWFTSPPECSILPESCLMAAVA